MRPPLEMITAECIPVEKKKMQTLLQLLFRTRWRMSLNYTPASSIPFGIKEFSESAKLPDKATCTF